MSDPRVSVIISTCNRADHLAELLNTLKRQMGVAFEVIVVNGPSTDHTSTLMADWADGIKSVDCPERSIGISRNRGIAMADGELAVFIDDDARPVDNRWLYRYARAAKEDETQQVAGWGGPVFINGTQTCEFNRGEVSDYCFLKFHPDWPRPPQGKCWSPSVCGCNMAFRSRYLRDLGGFDEYYPYYADETDVCRRFVLRGLAIRPLDDNGVQHYPTRLASGKPPLDRAWHVVARSDMRFCLQHGRGVLPLRMVRAVWYARSKHYVLELNRAAKQGDLPRTTWVRCLLRCVRGVLEGLVVGCFRPPSPKRFSTPPPSFKRFRDATPKREGSLHT